MHPYNAGIEVTYNGPLDVPDRPFTIRQGSSAETFDSSGEIVVVETFSTGTGVTRKSVPPPVPQKSRDGADQLGVSFARTDHVVHFAEGGTTTTRRRHKRKSSRQLLEAKLPALLRGNLSAFSSKSQVHTTTAGGAGSGHARTNSLGTAMHRHVRRHLEQRLAWKNLIVIFFSELFGTFTFLFFGLAINTTCSSVKARDKDVSTVNLQALQVSSLGYGFSLAISAWVFFRISGGVQNPAITLALTLTGALTWPKFVVLSVAQYLAGIGAAGMIDCLLPSAVDLRTTLASGVSVKRGFWLEFIMSAQLIFTVLMLAAEKHKGTYLAPVGIGLALFITQLLGQPYTGAGVNPARSLGPDIVGRKFESYAWLYYVSSYLAAVVTSAFFLALKWVRYETATPDQDADVDGVQYQLILDMDGNVIARMDTVMADELDEYHGHAASHAEKDQSKEMPPTSSPSSRLFGA